MVHACVVCKKVDRLNPDLSFHRFPHDPEKRKLWFALVGILDNQPLRKNPEVCSDHFLPEDILERKNGASYIRKGANPRRCEGMLFLDDLSNSSDPGSDSTISETPPPAPKKSLPSPVDMERKNIWFSLVGIEKNKELPRNAKICSDHFDPGDMLTTNINGRHYIKENANPQPVHRLVSDGQPKENRSTPLPQTFRIPIVQEVKKETETANTETSFIELEREITLDTNFPRIISIMPLERRVETACLDDFTVPKNIHPISDKERLTPQIFKTPVVPEIKIENDIADTETTVELGKEMKPDINSSRIISFTTQEQNSNFVISDNTPVIVSDNAPVIVKQEPDTSIEDLIAKHVLVTSGPYERQSENCEVTIKEERTSGNDSETSTSSEAEREMAKLTKKKGSRKKCSQKASRSVPVNRKCRYIGDLISEDFATPEKRKQNLALIKKTAIKQRKKIRVLQNKVRRLKLRVASLKSKLKSISKGDMSVSEPSDSE